MNTITLPELNEGEIYAGILLNESGAPQHHLILLPGDNNEANWQTQTDWAKSIGGELPTRAELEALLHDYDITAPLDGLNGLLSMHRNAPIWFKFTFPAQAGAA